MATNYDKGNIFAKILTGELPCKKIYEDEHILAFHDINPKAQVHILVIPKGDYQSYEDFIDSSFDIVHFFHTIKKIVHMYKLNEDGYRLVINHGKNGGQEVPHFHVHILGGRKIGELTN